jgi:hypothetical protein
LCFGYAPTFHAAFEDKALEEGKMANLSKDLQERIHRIKRIHRIERIRDVYLNAYRQRKRRRSIITTNAIFRSRSKRDSASRSQLSTYV